MPRSPSRDLSDRHRGSRSYFRRPDAVTRWKWLLSALALGMTTAWATVEVARPSAANAVHTHGTLTNPHAAWDNNCQACHAASSPGDFLANPLSAAHPGERWRNLTCDKCHSGPAHQTAPNATDAAFHSQCANCHHDHGGRANSLVKLTDAHCATCHGDLAPHASPGKPTANRVTNFATDHPDFAPLKTPPESRTLKFSHALHMTPGVAYSPGGAESLTVERTRRLFGPAVAERYRAGQDDKALVQLACASCHQLDAGVGTVAHDELSRQLTAGQVPAKAVLPPRAAGDYFLGVNFEASCRGCHPIAATPKASGGQLVAAFDLPHRVSRAKLVDEVRTGYLKQLLADDRRELDVPVGLQVGRQRTPTDAPDTLRTAADRYAHAEAGRLFTPDAPAGSQGCAKCHDLDSQGVRPVVDRTVWLPNAKFNHAAHRATTCLECHPGTAAAFAPVGTKLFEKEPVQILGVQSCRACHAPAGTPVTLADGHTISGGGVKHACTDCHSYHNATHPLQGRGAPARAPAAPLSLSDYFNGGKR